MNALVRVTRGGAIESVHSGHVCVVDADGTVIFEYGDASTPVYPRSAIKLLQALPLVATGAADAFGFSDEELALACSSHSGEPGHVETARSMLSKTGVKETCLACAGHWSLRQEALIEQARVFAAKPGPVCNNCSGKHAGMLAVCGQEGWSVEGYEHADHELQVHLADLLSDLTGTPHTTENRAVDGCSIPTYAVPLRTLAKGFAQAFRSHEPAARRLTQACMAHPWHTAGSDRFCTDFMRAGAGAVYAKTGAEGVYCGYLPDLGLSIALKVADGASRASEVAFATVANGFLERGDLAPFETVELTSWAGEPVGRIRTDPGFERAVLAVAAKSR